MLEPDDQPLAEFGALEVFKALVGSVIDPDEDSFGWVVKNCLKNTLKKKYGDERGSKLYPAWQEFLSEIRQTFPSEIPQSFVHQNPKFDVQATYDNIEKNLLGKWVQKKESNKSTPSHLDVAYAAYFWAHACFGKDYLGAARDIDKQLLGKPFEQIFGQKVPIQTDEANELLAAYEKRINESELSENSVASDHASDELEFSGPLQDQSNSVFEASSKYIIPSAPFSHPPYKFEDDVKSLLAQNGDHGVWLDPHNHYSIPKFPRTDAEARLTKFMKPGDSLRICPVIGPSGAGKTRLISEWMVPYVPTVSATNWDAGFVVSDNPRARDPKPWQKWNISSNTLIVIDYTYAFGDVVKAIVDRARVQRKYNVRLIVIDHVMPKFLYDDFFWSDLGGGHPATLDNIQTLIEPVIEIESEKDNSELLRHIIAKSASVGGQKYPGSHRVVTEALSQLDRMGHEQGNLDAVRHPLFAALMGQAIREADGNTPDFMNWSRRDLITYYFQGRDRVPWTGWKKKYQVKRGLMVGTLVSAATLRRGLDVTDVEEFLPKKNKDIVDWANRVVSNKGHHTINPFLPDILGETFLLKFLERIEDEEEIYETFLRVLAYNKMGNSVENSQNIYEVISRLARNLANDEILGDGDPRAVENLKTWDALCTFIDPARFAHDSQLRLAMSYSIAELMEQITGIINRLKNHAGEQNCSNDYTCNDYLVCRFTEIIQSLEQKYSTEDIEKASFKSDVITPTQSLYKYLEFKQSHISDTDISLLNIVSENYEESMIFPGSPAFLAAAEGRLNAFRQLWMKPSSALNSVKSYTASQALKIAIINGHLPVIEFLHEDGADIHGGLTETSRTALMLASEHGHLAVVQFLHGKGVNLNAATPLTGRTALIIAAENGHLPVVEFLHRKGASINAKLKFGTTAMMLASGNGHLQVVEYLYGKGTNINTINDDGKTALMYASESGRLPIVEFLYAKGSNDTKINSTKALMLASWKGHLPVVKFLCDNGADIDGGTEDGQIPAVCRAIESGHLSIVEFLYARGADINATTEFDVPPVMMAIQDGHLSVVEFLHNNGVNVNGRIWCGRTAIMTASMNGHLSMVEFLHDIGADIHAETEGGWTALNLACDGGHSNIVEWMLRINELNINHSGKDCQTALVRAAGSGHVEVVKLLLSDPRIEIEQQDQNGATALHFSAALGKQDSVVALLEAGANPTMFTIDGSLPSDFARRDANNIKLAETLEKAAKEWQHSKNG